MEIINKILLALLVLSISGGLLKAQNNGEVIHKEALKSFSDLVNYVQNTESRDSVGLLESRFAYFAKVKVYGITYWSDSLKVKGFLLMPKTNGIYPAIIYNRGGSLEHGSLTHPAASIGIGELARLAHQGYVIVASQYRGNGGGEGMEQYGGADINDVLNLIPLLESLPNVDSSKIGMFGWSRGGMTSFLTMKKNKRIKATALGAPSSDLTRSILDRPLLDEWWSHFIPNYNVNKAQVLKRRSVIYWVHELPKDVPVLLLQGENDIALHPDFTLDLAKAFTKHKVPYKLVKFVSGSHSLKEYHDEVFAELNQWFDHYLK